MSRSSFTTTNTKIQADYHLSYGCYYCLYSNSKYTAFKDAAVDATASAIDSGRSCSASATMTFVTKPTRSSNAVLQQKLQSLFI
jgi:hypothetical protein